MIQICKIDIIIDISFKDSEDNKNWFNVFNLFCWCIELYITPIKDRNSILKDKYLITQLQVERLYLLFISVEKHFLIKSHFFFKL